MLLSAFSLSKKSFLRLMLLEDGQWPSLQISFSNSERKQIIINVQSKALAPNRDCLRRLSAPTVFYSHLSCYWWTANGRPYKYSLVTASESRLSLTYKVRRLRRIVIACGGSPLLRCSIHIYHVIGGRPMAVPTNIL